MVKFSGFKCAFHTIYKIGRASGGQVMVNEVLPAVCHDKAGVKLVFQHSINCFSETVYMLKSKNVFGFYKIIRKSRSVRSISLMGVFPACAAVVRF